MAKSKRMQIYLTEKQYKQLLTLTKTSKLSIAELIRRAIDKYIIEKQRIFSEKDSIWDIHNIIK